LRARSWAALRLNTIFFFLKCKKKTDARKIQIVEENCVEA
jgi:hypothetical protein